MAKQGRQERMLPLMTATIVVLGVFFFAASLWQLTSLNRAAQEAPGLQNKEIQTYLDRLADAETPDQQSAIQRTLLTYLELDVTNRRHYITRVFLQASVWVKYLGFVTGMILTMVGAVFVLGKLRVPETEIDADIAWAKYRIRSASPGIILAVLGVALMVSTLAIRHATGVNDDSIYISEASLVDAAEAEAAQDDSRGGTVPETAPDPSTFDGG